MRAAVLVLAIALWAFSLTGAVIAYVKARDAREFAQASLALTAQCAVVIAVWRFMA